jgi:cell division protein FtsW
MNAAMLFGMIALLILQKDLGQSILFASVWSIQLFLSGYPLKWMFGLAGTGVAGLYGAYTFMPHVRSRIDQFYSADGDRYQINRAAQAFNDGGWLGVGPGEGKVKNAIPDVHNDFIFSVLGEEFGLMACIGVLLVYTLLVLRGIGQAVRFDSLFTSLVALGVICQLGLQALINMASTLALIPTKGMTLPFLSYGGSSLLSLAVSMGIFLAVTRRRSRQESFL